MPRPAKQNVMSVEGAFRNLIRDEIAAQLEPLQTAVLELQAQSRDLGGLVNLLSPLTNILAPFASAPPVVKRGPGRPPGSGRAKAGRSGANTLVSSDRTCAIIGCKRPSRSKGYCAAHYQKLRTLTRTHRKPAAWTEFAPPNSVPDVVLPRGRAAHKARKQA